MPGVLQVEAMAQLSGILGFISAGQTADDGYLYLFAGVDKVRFKKSLPQAISWLFAQRF